jgi:adenylate cyclase
VWIVDPATRAEAAMTRPRTGRTRKVLLLAAFLMACAGLAAWLLSARIQPPAATPELSATQASPVAHTTPVLAVLPFVAVGGDAQQNYLGDGIAEDLITDLSRLRNLTVIARSSSFRYRDRSPKAQDVQHDLGVSHLLEGSVRRAGERLRIAVQLIDAETGHQLWAERYDRVLDDVFEIQDEIARKIVARLSIELASGESEHPGRQRAASFAAYDVFLKGMQTHLEYTRDSNEQAQSYYREAITLDPGFGRAYGALAVSLARGVASGWYEDATQVLDQAVDLARTAVELDPYAPQTHWALGYAYYVRGEAEAAISAIERSVALAPNYADGYGMLALISNSLGKAEEAIAYVKRGMVLNPFYSWDYKYNLGRALYTKGDYAAAVTELQDALDRNSTPMFPRVFLAAALVRLDRLDDADWQILQLETDHPDLTLSRLEKYMPITDGPHKTRLFEDLRTAGMSE